MEGADACPACGTHVSQAPTGRAGAGQSRVALDAARRAQAAEGAKGVDVAVAKRLIEAAERAEAAGEFGKALDYGRAAKRAVEIARLRARIESDLARAEIQITAAREAGIDTLASERNLELARKAAYEGAFEDVENLLARTSLKALEGRQERHFKSLLERAAERIAHAKERGGDVSRAEEAHANARKAASMGSYGEARRHTDSAVDLAENARRYSRAEAFLVTIQAEAE
ncbi:MAG: hypothetical protein E6K16_00390, partial [Methanobacteriota archaeon]